MNKLNQFIPAGDLNRDETLLAMGRASARPNRLWIWLCVGLVVSHIALVVAVWWCWPRMSEVLPIEPAPVSYPMEPVLPPDPSSVLVLSQWKESTITEAGAMLSHPMLRAGSSDIGLSLED